MSAPTKRRFRDYNRRRYGNPLFSGSPRRARGASMWQTGAWKRPALAIVVATALGALCWYLFWSPTFRIGEFTINGATPETELRITEILEEHRAGRALFLFPRRSLFLFDSRGASAAIAQEFHLESLAITKRLPSAVTIEVVEIPKRALLHADGHFLAVSETGTIIRDLTEREIREIADLPNDIAADIAARSGLEMVALAEIDPSLLPEPTRATGNAFPLLFDGNPGRAGTSAEPGSTIFSRQTMALVLQANVRLPDIAGSPVRWFTIHERDEKVHAELKAGWGIDLATTLPFEIQGERLAAVLRESVGADRSRLELVSLLYGERIFIRYQDGN